MNDNRDIILTIILFFVTVVLGFSSCEERSYCATCYEESSDYYAEDFCGNSFEVEKYDPRHSDQKWICGKNLD
tara:strand:- start:193 stop:411 length:219 start_codon:yes stop_codon:yes gene_type:complete